MAHRVSGIQQHHPFPVPGQKVKNNQTSFKEIFKDVKAIKVSKHAQQRISERNIQINDKQWEIITKKMQEAKHKGVTDSLVVMKNAALLVSTQNNTVVTAMSQEEASAKIFTNINGTIVLNE
ncbi:TIGR02530 family flagellar biosynthesis protein [Virgibacillus sp. W0181]|uniref:TIGR02530 family flagellar biosynthesis protein n=1 Tax=Virgibacillus sp. W0181 TaxID=3391581 RepID=UPI003F467DB1